MEDSRKASDLFLSDDEAFTRAMSLPINEIVSQLLEVLDATTVAVIGGVQETRAVHGWLSGREPQRPQVLRFALQLALMIAGARDREFCKAWFHGSNPNLDDAVPMLLLRDRPLAEIQRDLIAAARVFGTRTNRSPDR
jgi:hypothetical protein